MNPLFLLALAATVTPAPTATITASPTSTDIQKIREVVQQKVQEKLKEITTSSTVKKGIIGEVVQKDPNQITIEYQGNTQVLSIDSDTVYVDSNRSKSTLDNIKIGQGLLAMGTQETDTKKFSATRIVFIDLKTVAVTKTVVVGKVVDISKTTSVFTLIPSKNKNTQYQIKTDSKTKTYAPDNSEIAFKNLQTGHRLIVVLTPDPKITNTYYASKILDLDYSSASPTPTSKP